MAKSKFKEHEIAELTDGIDIKLFSDRILVKRVESETVSKGGIIIPETAQEKLNKGYVVAVGPGEQKPGEPHEVKVTVGEKVLFGKYAGSEIEIDHEEYILIRMVDIQGALPLERATIVPKEKKQ